MTICIKIGPIKHCFVIPVLQYPVHWKIPGPGPVNYPQLFQDGMLLASLQAASKDVSDEHVRGALDAGIATAIKALGKRAGEHVSVEMN
jgi:hypothetical protein